MCNNCKETNQPETPTAINAAVELKEASDAVKRIHSAISDKGLTYYIETYGCQMNEHDSENIAGMLVRCGYTKADCKETADFILLCIFIHIIHSSGAFRNNFRKFRSQCRIANNKTDSVCCEFNLVNDSNLM